ncbi:MAG: histidine phosphatase family protein [Chloroflexota bacterium]
MTLQRVYLIRHGQTAWNVEGRWQGFEATPLNAVGLEQARALAAYWPTRLSAIYSSDLARAWQTAEILATAQGIRPIADERLREFNLGIFQGLTWEEMQRRYPAEADAFRADYMGYVVPGGESRRQLQRRAVEAFNEIVARNDGPEIAIVSHGGTLKVLLFHLFGETPALQALHMDNTAITTLERVDHGWRLAGLAETPHLAAGVLAIGDERQQSNEQSRPD